MTNHERQARNGEILDAVGEQVSKVEGKLSHLGRLEEDLYATRETVEKLSIENARLRANEDSTPKERRITKLQNNAAAIDLEQGDARNSRLISLPPSYPSSQPGAPPGQAPLKSCGS